MAAILCTIIAVVSLFLSVTLTLIIGAFVRAWWRAEDEREQDEALRQADYDGWMP